MYGTEVPIPKLGLDFRPGVEPECGTKMSKSELGLGFRVGNAASYFISLFYTTLVSYKSESRSLTNARQNFTEQRRKANPIYHRMLGSFFLERHSRTYVPELEPSSKATILVFYSHLNIHLEQITLDLTTGHIC